MIVLSQTQTYVFEPRINIVESLATDRLLYVDWLEGLDLVCSVRATADNPLLQAGKAEYCCN